MHSAPLSDKCAVSQCRNQVPQMHLGAEANVFRIPQGGQASGRFQRGKDVQTVRRGKSRHSWRQLRALPGQSLCDQTHHVGILAGGLVVQPGADQCHITSTLPRCPDAHAALSMGHPATTLTQTLRVRGPSNSPT